MEIEYDGADDQFWGNVVKGCGNKSDSRDDPSGDGPYERR